MELATTRSGESGVRGACAALEPQSGVDFDGFHQLLDTRVAEHRTRLVCLGVPPSPRVRWLPVGVFYLLTGTYPTLGTMSVTFYSDM
jgi:hypothetical protein